MELRLVNGKYVTAAQGGFETVSGSAELAQRIEMKLCARRGGFALMPQFGSRLYLLPAVRASEREAAARQYIAEALADEPQVELDAITLTYVGDSVLQLELNFSALESEFEISTTVSGV